MPVFKVCYIRVGNPSGYVIHEHPRSPWKTLLIGFGPLLVNTVVGLLVALPAVIGTFTFDSGDVLDALLLWLGFSIAMHSFPHAASQKWRGLRAIAVEFIQREGQGLRHKLARTQEGRLSPLLAANRDETIERIIQELQPPHVGDPRLIELPDGTAATAPTQRFFLPKATDETRTVLDTYERHLLAGARQERTADGRTLRYLDKCENHFLLATAYAALAETLVTETPAVVLSAIRPLPMRRVSQDRSLAG